MPKRFAVGLPDVQQRLKILNLVSPSLYLRLFHLFIYPPQMLQNTPLEPSFPMQTLAERSEGLSGSDLKELCRNAAMVPVREYVREIGDDTGLLAQGQLEVSPTSPHEVDPTDESHVQGFKIRPLRIDDFAHEEMEMNALHHPSVDRSRLDEKEEFPPLD